MRRALLLSLLLLSSCRDTGLYDYAYAIDGDTLVVGEERVRLWGIDAPELETFDGLRAKLFLLTKLQASGNTVACGPRRGASHERTVRQCYFGTRSGEDIAAYMVASGHARDWPAYSGGYYKRFEP